MKTPRIKQHPDARNYEKNKNYANIDKNTTRSDPNFKYVPYAPAYLLV